MASSWIQKLVLALFVSYCSGSILGCFKIPDDTHRIRHRHHHVTGWRSITNHDCAFICKDYPLAFTRGDICECHTSGVLSGSQALEKNLCDKTCNGSATWPGACVGDECCGGIQQQVYTVTTAGGPDWSQVILRRLEKALQTVQKNHILELGGPVFRPVHGPSGNGSKHHDNTEYDLHTKDSQERCQELCLQLEECRSILFYSSFGGCYIFNISSSQGNITDHDAGIMVHDKVRVGQVANKVFQMKLDEFSVILNHMTAESTHPLDNKVYELDLRRSNEKNELKRTISVKHLDHYNVRTLSGLNDYNTASTGNSAPECFSNDEPVIQLVESDNPFEVMNHHSLAPFSLEFRQELSSVLNGAAYTGEHRESTDTTVSKSQGKSMVHQDYKAKFMNTTTETYSVSMRVPRFHLGRLSFLLTEQHREFLWKARLQLSGYIQVCVGSEIKDIHVSRLLANEHRYFDILGQVFYTQHTITSKVDIVDHNGHLVQYEP